MGDRVEVTDVHTSPRYGIVAQRGAAPDHNSIERLPKKRLTVPKESVPYFPLLLEARKSGLHRLVEGNVPGVAIVDE